MDDAKWQHQPRVPSLHAAGVWLQQCRVRPATQQIWHGFEEWTKEVRATDQGYGTHSRMSMRPWNAITTMSCCLLTCLRSPTWRCASTEPDLNQWDKCTRDHGIWRAAALGDLVRRWHRYRSWVRRARGADIISLLGEACTWCVQVWWIIQREFLRSG